MLSAGQYGFDDISIADRIDIGSITVTEAMVDAFSDLTGDRFEIHMSNEAAERHGFQGRVAHGLLILSLVDGLKNQAQAQFKAQASLGWDWRFHGPVIVGDQISACLEVIEKTTISDPERGILTLAFEVINQRGELVQSGTNKLMVYR